MLFSDFNNFNWNGIEKIRYKPEGNSRPATFSKVSRQNIFIGNSEACFDQRYFECGPGGFTTLEKHQHLHFVIVLRGKGAVINGNEVFRVKPFDMIRIPPWNPHQLINASDEPFGFLCTVNGSRDPFQLLSRKEAAELEKNSEIAGLMQIPEGYFDSTGD